MKSMENVWVVYTDGSRLGAESRRGVHGPGGYGAVVEHGSDGYVVRGRDPSTTNTRMELVAAIRALETCPEEARVSLHTDCSAIFLIYERWRAGHDVTRRPSGVRVRDHDLWQQLAAEFARVHSVGLVHIPRGGDPIHRRAHGIAAAEARAAQAGFADHMVALSHEDRRSLLRDQRKHMHRTGSTSVEDAFAAAIHRKRR